MLTLLLSLFAFDTLLFWGLVGVWCIVTIIVVDVADEDHEGWLFFLSLIAVGLVIVQQGALAYITHHPLTIVAGFLGYFAVAVLWSFFKWNLFIGDAKAYWLEFSAANQVSATEWRTTRLTPLDSAARGRFKTIPPHPRDHKTRLVGWIMYWPASAIWFVVHDPIYRFSRYLYTKVSGIYARMATRAFAGVELNPPKLEPPTQSPPDDDIYLPRTRPRR